MMTLTRWSPARDLANFEVGRLNRMFEGAFSGEPIARDAWVPQVDIYETPEGAVVVKAELPEMSRDDIKVTVENDVLTIEGERTVESVTDGTKYYRVERGAGAFRRSFTLPTTVDAAKVAASYRGGVLTVTLPPREEARQKAIKIEG